MEREKKTKIIESPDDEIETPLFPYEEEQTLFAIATTIASHMNDIKDISNFCKSLAHINHIVCHNPKFWLLLIKKYFKKSKQNLLDDYKDFNLERWEDVRYLFIKFYKSMAIYELNLKGDGITNSAFFAALGKIPGLNNFVSFLEDLKTFKKKNVEVLMIYNDGAIEISIISRRVPTNDWIPTMQQYRHIWVNTFSFYFVENKPREIFDRWTRQYFFEKDFDQLQIKDVYYKNKHRVFAKILFLLKVWDKL